MFCIAYPMRRDGKKLSKAEIQAGGKRGWLTYARMPAGQPVWTAKLTGQGGGDIFPELTCAEVKAINGGILVAGFVRRPGPGAPERQAWYCEPTEAPAEFEPPRMVKAGRRG